MGTPAGTTSRCARIARSTKPPPSSRASSRAVARAAGARPVAHTGDVVVLARHVDAVERSAVAVDAVGEIDRARPVAPELLTVRRRGDLARVQLVVFPAHLRRAGSVARHRRAEAE